MKRIFTKISVLCLVAATVLATGCLKDETQGSKGGGSGSKDPVIPDNSVMDTRVFKAMNLDAPALAGVKAYYESEQYYLAAQALLQYYRGRTDVQNGNVNLIAPSILRDEQIRADSALSKNLYRFFVEGFTESDGRPYSYATSKKLDWTKCETNKLEQHRGLHRMQWMIAQGKAYRVSLDETYAKDFVAVYADWFLSHERPVALPGGNPIDYEADPSNEADEKLREQLYAWRPIDVAYRLEDQCDLLYYFMQSSSITPQWFADFMGNMCEQAAHVRENLVAADPAAFAALDPDAQEVLAKKAHAIFRAGVIFPEMKNASEWVETAKPYMNDGIDTKVFEVLNLDYSGLTKVANAYRIGDYYKALEELLVYYRARTHGLNPLVDLTKTPTENERRWADYALESSDYRFYVKNFFESGSEKENNGVPYSYKKADGTIDWQYWPTRDQEHRYQLHRHQWMVPQAKTYYSTNDDKYVNNWYTVFSDWFRQNPRPDVDLDYTKYPDNQAPEYRNAGWTWRPLDVAARLMDHIAVLEYYQNAGTINFERLSEVYYFLDQQTNHIVKNYSSDSNHLITQAQAVTFAGLLLPELKNAASWVASGSGVLNSEVTRQYYPDGWLMDGDLHYHIAGIEDFRSAMLAAKLNGQENRFPASYKEAIRKMTEVVMNMVYPNYSVPNMTDTRRDTWSKSVLTRNLTNYAALFPENAELQWMASEGKSGSKPTATFKSFPDAGYYVLRSGWTKDDMMMVIQNTTVSPKEKWHRQWDNNTFELFVKGRNFFPDSGCFTYTSGADRNKFAATSAHNTITLDGKNVTTCSGQLLLHEVKTTSTFNYETVVLENPSYAGLTHRRAIFLVDNKFYVIVDEAYGDAAGAVNLNYHLCEGKDAEFVSIPGGVRTNFADGNNLTLFCASSSIARLNRLTGFVSYNTDENSPNRKLDRPTLRIDSDKTAEQKAVRFVTVLMPTKDGSEVMSSGFSGDWNKNATTVTVTVDGKQYKLSYVL